MQDFFNERKQDNEKDFDEAFKENEVLNLKNKLVEKDQKIEDLEKQLNAVQDVLINYINRQEKTQDFMKSTQNLKELETQRLKLLYKKWEDLSDILKQSSYNQTLCELVKDFDYALKIVVDGTLNSSLNDKSYAKSVLSKMSGEISHKDNPIVTKKYVARSYNKHHKNMTAQIFEEELVINQTESDAEKFLNGTQTYIPKSLGVGKEMLSIPPKEQQKQKKEGFSLEEALTPKESLKEIMAVFKLDD